MPKSSIIILFLFTRLSEGAHEHGKVVGLCNVEIIPVDRIEAGRLSGCEKDYKNYDGIISVGFHSTK